MFVVIGRNAHGHGLGLTGIVSTCWPFVSGLALGWLALVLSRANGLSVIGGLVASGFTVAVGMVLRVISGQGTAPAFIAVATGFLGASMLAWRLVAARFAKVLSGLRPEP